MKKRYRSILALLLTLVLTVTPSESLFVDASTLSDNSDISSNLVSMDLISPSEDTVSKNTESVSPEAIQGNDAVISADESGTDVIVISSDDIKNAPEITTESGNAAGEISANETYKNNNEELVNAVWGDYSCKLDTGTNVLTLVSYNKSGRLSLKVSATAEGVKIINGDIETPYDKTCSVRIGSVSSNGEGYWSDQSVWNKTAETLKSLSFEQGVKLNPFAENIFKGLENLESLDISKLDTSDSTYMYSMFGSCKSLKSLDLSGFDTSNVEDMSEMFYDCSSLESLDLSNFDTSGTITMSQMFYGCTALNFLNLGSFDTYNVKNMYEMFDECDSIRYLNLSHFDLSGSGTDMLTLIKNCTNLRTLITPITMRSFSETLSSDLTKPLKRLYLSPLFTGTLRNRIRVINDAGMTLYGPASLEDEVDYINLHHEEMGITGGDLTLVDIATLKDIDNPYSGSYIPEESRVSVTGVTLDKENIEITVDQKVILTPTITPEKATNKRVSWSVGNSYVASVSNGVVTGKTAGSTIVTVTTEDGGYKASCTVSVNDIIYPEEDPSDPVYKVNFKNGELILETQHVRSGRTAKLPAVKPVKSGYSFMGWSVRGSLWNFSTPVFSDITLIPKFIAVSGANVSGNSGSGLDPAPNIVKKSVYIVKGRTCKMEGKNWGMTENAGVIKISAKTGKLTGLKKGKAIIVNDEKAYYVYVADTSLKKEARKLTMMVGTTVDIGSKIVVDPYVSGDEIHYPVTWVSSNPKIATVNDGMITAFAKGKVNIIAYVGGKAHVCKLTVANSYKAPGKQTKKSISFNMNPLQTINLRYNNEIFTVKGATWSGNGIKPSVDKNHMPDGGYENDIVRISRTGKITAIGRGTTSFTGKDKRNREVSVNITVKTVPDKTDHFVTAGKKDKLRFSRVNGNKAVWNSGNPDVVSVYTGGKIVGSSVGTSTVSCAYNPYKPDKPFVFATRVRVESPEFNTDDGKIQRGLKYYSLDLKKGEIYNRVTMKNVFQTVMFKNSRPSVAFIDENGVIYARSKGKTNITTRINGRTYRLVVYVSE